MSISRCVARVAVALVLSGTGWSRADLDVPAPEIEPWRWADPDRKPFHPWHPDSATQVRLLAEARAHIEGVMGMTLESPPEILIAPGWMFYFASLETGAKDGSLFLDTSVTRAMELLSFVAKAEAKPESIGPDWRGDPTSANHYAEGVYVPKHVRRMIWVNPDRAEEDVRHILQHEYVHALQDEAYPIEEFFAFEGITADEKFARSVIEEGFAMLVGGVPNSSRNLEAEKFDGRDWSARLLGFRYGHGLWLLEQLSARTESRRGLLELVFQRPPTSTREVLHHELYEQYLDSGTPLGLPEPNSFKQLREIVTSGLAAAGQPLAWRSRLGEFALQSLLIELGMPDVEAIEAAAGWRNDSVTNHGEWRSPTTTTSVWTLETPEKAQSLAARMRELLSARGARLTTVSMRASEPPLEGHAALDDGALPQVLLLQQGQAVAYLVGADLAALVTVDTPR